MRIRIYAGQYYDSETGLHYNYHRYYDPKTGRYLTPDPIGLLGGINPYVYTFNNPINKTDPFGLRSSTLIKPGPFRLDPSVHNVFQDGTYEHQLIANDLNRVAWIFDPGPLMRDAGHLLFGGGLGHWVYDLTHPSVLDGPRDPTSVEEWKQWAKERDNKLSDETGCETRTPWMGPGNGYDPEDPDNDPKAPLWKKIARVIMDIIRAGNP